MSKEAIEKIRKGIHDCCKIIAFLQTDDETYEVGEDLDVATKQFSEALKELEKQPEPKCKTCRDTKWVENEERIDGYLINDRCVPCPDCKPEPTEFEEWFANEYPLPPTIERGPVGRDFKTGCRKAWDKAQDELDRLATENKRLKEELSKWENMTAEELGEMIAGM